MAELHIVGEIVGATGFEDRNLFCKVRRRPSPPPSRLSYPPTVFKSDPNDEPPLRAAAAAGFLPSRRDKAFHPAVLLRLVRKVAHYASTQTSPADNRALAPGAFNPSEPKTVPTSTSQSFVPSTPTARLTAPGCRAVTGCSGAWRRAACGTWWRVRRAGRRSATRRRRGSPGWCGATPWTCTTPPSRWSAGPRCGSRCGQPDVIPRVLLFRRACVAE